MKPSSCCAAPFAGSGRAYLRLDETSNQWARTPSPDGSMAVLRRGQTGTVVAVGPMLDRVLAATTALDITVLYASTVRPFDAATLRATLCRADVVLVEPYLAGTSAAAASAALVEVPHRLLALGVRQAELRHYGTIADHDRAHGLDAAGLAENISSFLRP